MDEIKLDEIKYGEILGPGDKAGEGSVRRNFWKTLRRAAKYIPFAEDLVAAYYCALDPKSPTRVRAVLLAALAYFVLPFDAIPDFLAGIGYSDDATILLAAIAMVRAHINPAHRSAAKQALAGL